MSNSAKVRKTTEENEIIRRKGISESSKNRKASEETCIRISLAKIGNKNPMFGKKWRLINGKREYYI
jgi:hypothetical protein